MKEDTKDYEKLLQRPDFVVEDENVDQEEETEQLGEEDEVEEVEAEESPPETEEQAESSEGGTVQFYRDQVDQLHALINKLIDGKTDQAIESIEIPKPQAYDFKKAEKTYAKLILEGEEDKAVELREEIESNRAAQFDWKFAQFKAENEKKAEQRTKTAPAQMRFQMRVEEAEIKYPALRKGTKEYDEDLVSAVNGLIESRVAKGMDASQALDLALKKFVSAPEAKPKLGDLRTEQAKKKAAVAQKQQPPLIASSVRSKGSKPTITSFDDYTKLTQGERELLRGLRR